MSNPTVRIELDVPRDLLNVLNTTETDAEPRLLELIAIELFREDEISSGKAAELLGMSKASFIQLLGQRNIPYFTETPDELEKQVEAIGKVLNRASATKSE
jgi:predicted HTH domain antitoxin